MDLVVWNIVTCENIEFFDNMEAAIAFIKESGNKDYKITSCS